MKVKAVYFPDRMKVEFGEVTVPEPGPDDVVTETKYSLISNGTEGSFLRGERIDGETPWRSGDVWPFPVAPGYQSTGIVRAVGANVTDLRPGQWVFCALGRVEGMYQPWGGHMALKVSPRAQVWVVPDGVSPIAVSGRVLTQVGYNSATRPPLAIGDGAVVVGDGLVGQWTAQTLHWRGARVLLAGRRRNRLALFGRGPARDVVDTTTTDLLDAVKGAFPEGPHVLVDTVGSVSALHAMLPLIRRNGHIVSTGFHGTDSMFDLQRLRFRECTLHSPSGWQSKRMDETLALIAAGHLQVEPLITHTFPAEEAAQAWKLIVEKDPSVLGVLLKWP